MEASDTTTQRNYYDDLAMRAVGNGPPLEAAVERAASAYLIDALRLGHVEWACTD